MFRSFMMVAGVCSFATAAAADPPSPLINPSFERGLEGWTKTGTAFDTQPTLGDNVRAARVTPVSLGGTYWVDLPYPIGIRGTSWIGTYENRRTPNARLGTTQGDGPTGTLTSARFKIPADVRFISFLIGGGDDVAKLKLELLDASGATLVAAPGISPKTGHGSEILRRDWWRVDALDKTKDHVIRITDAATGAWGHINIDDLRFERTDPATTRLASGQPAVFQTTINQRTVWSDYDAPLWGAADLHTHPMSHLSMGKKMLHGAPDIGSLIPAGTQKSGHGCNPRDVRATSVAQALGDCSATHGGWGTDNTCGDYLRAFAINIAFDGEFIHLVPMPHDAKCAAGQVYDAGLCYAPCRPGFHGRGPMCHKDCPAGFRDDGLHCAKPAAYGRGTGYALNFGEPNLDGAMARCRRDHRQGCEQHGLIIYPKCRAGFHNVACCVCSPSCPAGMTDIGVSCQKNGSYGRGVGTPPPSNVHGDHPHAGYPRFLHWPHPSTKAHQQMYVDWIERAHQGGLRVLVALAVNNELLGEVVGGSAPKDDQAAADLQIDEIRAFIRRHAFMREVGSAAELRKAIKDGKLAVIVGIEIDNIGNFNRGNPSLGGNEGAIRREIRRLHQKGVRYVFPIHFADNVFGGAAVKGALFNLSNRFARTRPLPIGLPYPPGFLYSVRTASDPSIGFRLSADLLGKDGEWAHGLTFAAAQTALAALSGVPFPPAFHATSCPVPVLGCVPQFKLLTSMLSPDPQWDLYQFVQGGHQNSRDLTPLGEAAINEMMKLGMIIDIDHMSDLAANETLALARGYPLNSGHTGFRDLPGLRREEINENMRSSRQLTRIGELGGMMGVGWANGHAGKFLEAYEWGIDHKRRTGNGPSPAFTLGSDINGFEGTPWPRHSTHPKARAHINKLGRGRISAASWNTRVQYSGPGALRQYTFAERTWDYNVDGVAHIGLYPDFYQDLKNLGMREDALDHFFRAADAFARMWDKIEVAKTSVR
jgi:microsomal dipeptidase-like Zn-dependent dipeptidase